MSTKKPKSINSLLSGELAGLAALGRKAEEHQTLLHHVQNSLPDALGIHVFAADCESDTLTVVCDSAAWATRIRFYSESLLENLAPYHKTTISRVAVKVRPPWRPNNAGFDLV